MGGSRHKDEDLTMLWAACSLGFFCFLRIKEMMAPGEQVYDHLTREDVAVDSPKDPVTMQIHLKQLQTDPFHKGIFLSVGRTSTDLCPILAMLNFLAIRGGKGRALVHFEGWTLPYPTAPGGRSSSSTAEGRNLSIQVQQP